VGSATLRRDELSLAEFRQGLVIDGADCTLIAGAPFEYPRWIVATTAWTVARHPRRSAPGL